MKPSGDQPDGGDLDPRQRRNLAVESLAERARGGDSAARDRLLELIRPEVLAICGRFLPNRSDAEEACQDALLAVARHLQTFEGRSQFRTWLRCVTANAARDTYRKLKQQSHAGDEALARRADPRTTSVIAGTRIDVLDALEKIDQRFAEPVVLRDLCGLDYADIARQLDVPPGTVKSRIHEGRALVRARLER